MPAGGRAGCDAWFGKTFNVLDNGRFSCAGLGAADRGACNFGASRWTQPLVTFA